MRSTRRSNCSGDPIGSDLGLVDAAPRHRLVLHAEDAGSIPYWPKRAEQAHPDPLRPLMCGGPKVLPLSSFDARCVLMVTSNGRGGIAAMKAARLYEYDREMNVGLVIETVSEPTINSPDSTLVPVTGTFSFFA